MLLLPAVLGPIKRFRRRLLLHRRPLAALTAAAAVLAGFQAAAPPPPRTVGVLAADRDLRAGTVLAPGDLRPVRLDPDAVPAGSVRRTADVLGRTLAAPMARGEVLTGLRTVSRGLLAGYPGRTAVPVRVTDAAVVDLLRVGDRVSLVVADPEDRSEPAVLAEDVPVAAIPRQRGGAFSTGTPGRLVVVAVERATATEVASRAISGFLTVVWDR